MVSRQPVARRSFQRDNLAVRKSIRQDVKIPESGQFRDFIIDWARCFFGGGKLIRDTHYGAFTFGRLEGGEKEMLIIAAAPCRA